MKNILKQILFWIWSQPQTLIGFIIYLLTKLFGKLTFMEYKGTRITYVGRKWGGISLGRYIFMCNEMMTDDKYPCHKQGHSLQSLMLGPLYLLVIAIPSLLRATYCIINRESAATYHKFYTEAWADKLSKE